VTRSDQEEREALANTLAKLPAVTLRSALATLSPRMLRGLIRAAAVARDPVVAAWQAEIDAKLGANWDPESDTARRLRAIGYAQSFLDYVKDAGATDASELKAILEKTGYFESVRELLANTCDPAYLALSLDRALALLAPSRGTTSSAGVIARWSADVHAFGDRSSHSAAGKFRQAGKDARGRRKSLLRKR